MATGSKTRYSIELDFTTGKAEQSIKAATDKIKERLNSIATEANKTKYFEGLIGDIRDVDTQLTQLKEKHGKDFESIYQGIGECARQEFESVFTYARSETEKFYAEVKAKQVELSELQQIQKDYTKYSKSAVQAMNDENISGFGKSMGVTQVQNMYNSFDKLLAKKAEFEKVGNTSSKEYLENYVQILKTASGLIKADAEVANDDKDFGIDVEALYNMAEKAKSILNSLDINGFASRITDAINLVKANLQEQMKSFAEEMPNRIKNAFSGVGGNNQADQNKTIALSYDELYKKLNEYLKLQKMADEGIDFDSDGKNIQDQIADLEDYFDALGKTDEEIRKIQDITGNVAFNDLGIEDAIQQMSEFINIVNASEESINSLRNSIQEVFMSSSNIETDTRSGKLNGKESMNLFDINGNVSTVQGADYQVDTDTLVKQVVANLNKNIVMSLHNHANGDLTFSPSDISSFAKLYYGQGTKINGIIADGIIQTIDFNGVSQDIAIKIAQDYQEGIKNLFSLENIARFASFEDGEIVPTDLLKQIQTNNAAEYKEIVNQLQEATMITLRQAFESNGVEFTLQSFNVDSIEELAQYLSNIQQNGQAAIEPVEKLKNLVETLQPGTDLEQFTEIFDKFKSGAIDGTQALNQILDFKTISTDVNTATVSIEQAEARLKEFLALTEEIRTKNFDCYGDAEDNVEVGKYTERLTTAKAALDALGDQGLLTAEQLNQAQEAFNRAKSNLDLSTSHYSGYGEGNYYYSYYDEYKEQQDRANELEAQNRDLQEQLNNVQKTSTEQNQNAQYSAEIAQLDRLKEKLAEVKQAVDLKTQAFEEEYVTVDAAVDAEVQSLQLLLNQLQEVLKQINLISEGFTKTNAEIAELHNIKDVDIKENITSETTAEKAAETISQNYALDSTLTETNGILGQILAAISNNESIKGFVEPLTSAVAELKNVANGIVQEQKARKTDTSVAQARISNKDSYVQIKSAALDSLGDRAIDSDVTQMKALANGVVQVTGWIKTAEDAWEGFTVKVNKAGKASGLAFDKNAKAAKQAAAEAKALQKTGDVDSNPYKYNKDEVEARAQKHLDELTARGKNATVQFKDSGRYTITILEEIDGLSKQIFQTFDENDEKIERTTATISNAQKVKLESLKTLIETGITDNLVGDKDAIYQQYQKANEELERMNGLYRSKDSLENEDIATWNAQIKLVQQLASSIENLIQKRKIAVESETFKSDRGKKLSKYDLDLAELKADINIPDSFNTELNDARKAIESAADSESLKIAVNNWEALKNKIKKTATEQDLYIKKSKEVKNAAPDKSIKGLDTQKNAFAKYKVDLGDISRLSKEAQDKLQQLETDLNNISDADGLNKWKSDFQTVKKEVSIAAKLFEDKKLQASAKIKGNANAQIKTLNFKDNDTNLAPDQQKIIDLRDKLNNELAEYELRIKNCLDANLDAANQTKAALDKEIAAYKERNNIVNASGNANKQAPGATTVGRATNKYKSLSNIANSDEFKQSSVIQQILASYTAAYQKLVNIQSKFKVGEKLTDDQQKEFDDARIACNNYAKELEKVINASQKLKDKSSIHSVLGGDFVDNDSGRQTALKQFVEDTYGANATVIEFKDNFNKLIYTVDNGDGTFSQMTAEINASRTAIDATTRSTKEATSTFGKFWNELKGKFKSIGAYLTASFSIQEAWQQIRQGIQYVREIDSALTELKKVTDETDATYDQFLQTAAKTSSIIGSTVSEFTNATADFARLGYNLEQATSLAEAASVYKNVGDGIDDISQASESIISTMKAFGIEAEDAMGIVDRFNEVGNNFAISSTGIGEAMQRSASALYEAGNTIDESVALITAANSVVQNPEQVGEMLADIT